MIACTRCGFQNEDSDQICGSCATVLEWSGDQEAAQADCGRPEPVAAAPPVQAVSQSVSYAPRPAVFPLLAPPPPAPPPPLATSATATVQPEAVEPAAVKSRLPPQKPTIPSRAINEGDKVCRECGEGNEPARRFCRRCGNSLEEAEVFAVPWYGRLGRRLKSRHQHVAGDRPKGEDFAGVWAFRWLLRLVAVGLLVFLVLVFAGPFSKPLHRDLRPYYDDVFGAAHPTYAPIGVVRAEASSSAPGHPAAYLIDGRANTSWQASGPASGEVINLRLASPTNIDEIRFLSGDDAAPRAFVTEPRPEEITMVFNGTHPYRRTAILSDSPSSQTFTVGAKDATAVTITIKSAYPSAKGHHVSVTEIDLFRKTN